MKRTFSIGKGFKVSDGTIVYPFLNPKDMSQDLEWDLLEGFSVAGGDIGPGITSKIHVHPIVTQVTWVVSGAITIKMKDSDHNEPYLLKLQPQQAVLTQPRTFFQLINEGKENARVLYIVSPAYLFEIDAKGKVVYDDAISLDQTWEELAMMHWTIPQYTDLKSWQHQRNACFKRLHARKQRQRSQVS
jgi:mannose-6-phosphate isomerase-like protein (cupin superfamily)